MGFVTMTKSERTKIILDRVKDDPNEFVILKNLIMTDFGWDTESSITFRRLIDTEDIHVRMEYIQ